MCKDAYAAGKEKKMLVRRTKIHIDEYTYSSNHLGAMVFVFKNNTFASLFCCTRDEATKPSLTEVMQSVTDYHMKTVGSWKKFTFFSLMKEAPWMTNQN